MCCKSLYVVDSCTRRFTDYIQISEHNFKRTAYGVLRQRFLLRSKDNALCKNRDQAMSRKKSTTFTGKSHLNCALNSLPARADAVKFIAMYTDNLGTELGWNVAKTVSMC